jgi:hypothetical protein
MPKWKWQQYQLSWCLNLLDHFIPPIHPIWQHEFLQNFLAWVPLKENITSFLRIVQGDEDCCCNRLYPHFLQALRRQVRHFVAPDEDFAIYSISSSLSAQ